MKKTYFFDNMTVYEGEKPEKYKIDVPDGAEAKEFHLPIDMDIPDSAIPLDLSEFLYPTTDGELDPDDPPVDPDTPDDPDDPEPGPDPGPEPPGPEPEPGDYGPITIYNVASGERVTVEDDYGVYKYHVLGSGHFIAYGGSEEEPVENVEILLESTGNVKFELSYLYLDNNNLTDGNAIIKVSETVDSVTFNTTGASILKSGSNPCCVIESYANTLTSFTGTAVLTILDGSHRDNIASKGIYSLHDVEFVSGNYVFDTNDSNIDVYHGDIIVNGGVTFNMYSDAHCMKTNGNVTMLGGTVRVVHNRYEAILCTGAFTMNAGQLFLEESKSDGVRAEDIVINDGYISIVNVIDNPRFIYYDNNLYNSINVVDDTTRFVVDENVTVSLGNHHGLHAGTEGKTFHYDSDPEPIIIPASGSLLIHGGTIDVRTTGCGSITHNENDLMEFTIYGKPGDGLKSESSIVIDGGSVTVTASGVGIHSLNSVTINMGDPDFLSVTGDIGIKSNHVIFDGHEVNVPTYTINSQFIGILGLTEIKNYTYRSLAQDLYDLTMIMSKTGNNIEFNGGRLIVLNSYGNAICSYGDILFNGGELNIYNDDDKQGDTIYCSGDSTIGDGMVLFMGGNLTAFDNYHPTTTDQAYVVFHGTFMARTTARISRNVVEYYVTRLPKKCNSIFFTSNELVEGNIYVFTADAGTDTAVAVK